MKLWPCEPWAVEALLVYDPDDAAHPAPFPASAGLPAIPLRDVIGPGDLPRLEPHRLAALIAAAERRYPRAGIALAERLSRRWLERAASPYLAEIAAGRQGSRSLGRAFPQSQLRVGLHLQRRTHRRRAGCTPDPRPRLALRGARWPDRRCASGRSGRDVDQPHLAGGFAGCIQGHVPGRFAAAFNQAPLRRRSPSFVFDWFCERYGLWRARAAAGAFAAPGLQDSARLRRCQSKADGTPLALPAIFSPVGVAPNEQAVIEHLENRAVVHEGPR